nr:tyrosine-type recombinase/integrase [uncultured Erwinia sp.]
MAARRRNHKTRDLPPNLYVRNDGYYSYRDPRTGKEYGLGRDKRYAVTQAIDANMSIVSGPMVSLVDRLNDIATVTMSDWCARYMEILTRRGVSQSSLRQYAGRVEAIRKAFSSDAVTSITTKNVAEFLESYILSGKITRSKLIRSTFSDLFREAIAEGLVTINPVDATRNARVVVKRSRLSADDFDTILLKAGDGQPWIALSVKLALVTAQRVSDIVKMRWDDIQDGRLRVEQQKTGMKLAIPLTASIHGITLSSVIEECRKLHPSSATLITTRMGAQLTTRSLSDAFAAHRNATGLTWEGNPPSFHEIRSLAARLYQRDKGEKYAQNMLGHKSAEMTERYTDARGSQWLEVE